VGSSLPVIWPPAKKPDPEAVDESLVFNICNRSQVQGSTFSAASGHRSCQFDQKSDAVLAASHTRVKEKERIEDPKSLLKNVHFPK
jgi:hypothetical protein